MVAGKRGILVCLVVGARRGRRMPKRPFSCAEHPGSGTSRPLDDAATRTRQAVAVG